MIAKILDFSRVKSWLLRYKNKDKILSDFF